MKQYCQTRRNKKWKCRTQRLWRICRSWRNKIAGLGEINKIAGQQNWRTWWSKRNCWTRRNKQNCGTWQNKTKFSWRLHILVHFRPTSFYHVLYIKITLSNLKFFQNKSAFNFTSSFKVKRLSLLDFKPLSGPPPHWHSLRYITSSRSTPQKYPIISIFCSCKKRAFLSRSVDWWANENRNTKPILVATPPLYLVESWIWDEHLRSVTLFLTFLNFLIHSLAKGKVPFIISCSFHLCC